MQNVFDIKTNLASLYKQLDANEIDVKKASELSKIALKMIEVTKLELAYYALRKEKPEIEFFNKIKNITPEIEHKIEIEGDRMSITRRAIQKLNQYTNTDPIKENTKKLVEDTLNLVKQLQQMEEKP